MENNMKLIENQDYELTPSDNDGWNVRILSGEYVETIFQFGKITVNEDAESLTFDFELISSPIEDLNAYENSEFQTHTGKILSSILEDAVENSMAHEKEEEKK